MTKPLYFYNGTTFELVGPTTPQSPIAYQTSAPTAPATGDIWIDSDGDVDTYNRQLTRYYFVATAGQTSVTGVDANGLTLAYVAGSEAVYVNGALQVRGVDYTATNGTSITGLSALGLNDVVEVFAYTAFTVANAYTKTETDGVAAAAAGLRMVVPTSVSVGSGSGSVDAIGNVTFSGASSIAINGAFTSVYDNYKVLISFNTPSADANIYVKFRVGTTDTSSAYYWGYYGMRSANTTFSGTVNNDTAGFYIGDLDSASTRSFYATSMDIFNPNIANATSLTSQTSGIHTSGGSLFFNTGCWQDSTSQFTGLNIILSAGNASGTVRVYGYKD